MHKYLHATVVFDTGTGCIPPGSACYCYQIDGDYFWVCFRYPVLGQTNLKLHREVIEKNGRIIFT